MSLSERPRLGWCVLPAWGVGVGSLHYLAVYRAQRCMTTNCRPTTCSAVCCAGFYSGTFWEKLLPQTSPLSQEFLAASVATSRIQRCNASKLLWSSRLPNVPIGHPCRSSHELMKLLNVKISSRIITYDSARRFRILKRFDRHNEIILFTVIVFFC